MTDLHSYLAGLLDRVRAHRSREEEKAAEQEKARDAIAARNAAYVASLPLRSPLSQD